MSEKKRRRGHGEGTAYKRPDGRWQWRATMPDGSRKSFYGRTRTEAKAKADEAIDRMRNGLEPANDRLTVAAYITDWLDTVAANRIRPTTLVLYRSLIKTHIVPELGAVRLRTLTPQQVNRFLTKIVSDGLSPRTANRIRAVLATALADAVKTGILQRNVASLSEPRKEQHDRVSPLSLEQIRQFLAATRDHRHGPLWQVAVATGARQGELLALRWQDVDLERGVLHIRHTLTRHDAGWHLTDPKTEGSRRDVKLTAGAIDAFKRQQGKVAELEMLAAHRWQENHLVFPGQTGNPLHGPKVTAILRRELRAHGLPESTFHSLRHATATLMLAEGVDLFTVKEVLGHSSIRLTADTYGHLTRKLADEAAAKLSAALDAKTDARPVEQRWTDRADGEEASGEGWTD